MTKRFLSIITVVAAFALTATAVAVAGNVTATATVTGAGALGLSHSTTASVSSTLDGSDQTANYTIPLSIDDARGSGAGWNATITSTTFDDGAGHTLPTNASSVTGTTATCRAGGSCTAPTNSISYPLTIPAGTTAPAAVKLFNAAANTGMGRFTVTPTIAVTMAGNVYAGNYTSTVTFAVASGP